MARPMTLAVATLMLLALLAGSIAQATRVYERDTLGAMGEPVLEVTDEQPVDVDMVAPPSDDGDALTGDADVADYGAPEEGPQVAAQDRMLETQYVGGHGEKVADKGLYTPAPTTSPTAAPTKAPTQAPTPKPTTATVLKKPTVHTSHAQEYIGEVTHVDFGIQTPAPAPRTKAPSPVLTKKPVLQQVSKTTAIEKPKTTNPKHPVPKVPTGAYGGKTVVHPPKEAVKRPAFSKPHEAGNGWYGGKVVVIPAKTTKIAGTGTEKKPATVAPKSQQVQVPAKPGQKPKVVSPAHHKPVATARSYLYSSTQSMKGHLVNYTEVNATVGNLHSRYKGVEYGGKSLHSRVDMPGRCISWGQPHWMETFDGKKFASQGVGEFVLYADSSRHEQVNVIQKRWKNTSANVGVAFRNGVDVISVVIEKQGAVSTVIVRLNGVDVRVSASRRAMKGFTILQEGALDGARRLTVAVRNANGTKVAASVYRGLSELHMDVFVQVPGSRFNNTQGLCGTYDFQRDNELKIPSGRLVTDLVQFATRWSVSHPSTQFSHYSPPPWKESPVVVSPTGKQLSKTVQDLPYALHQCKVVPGSWRQACAQQVLVQTLKLGLAETKDIVAIADNGVVTVDAKAQLCVKTSNVRLGQWSDFTPCSSACAQGTQTRTRPVFTAGKTCGSLSQKVACQSYCKKADVWSRCALFGSGHLQSFDHQKFDFSAAGEFVMYYDANSRERVDVLQSHIKVGGSAQTTGVSVRQGANTFSVQLLEPTYGTLKVTFNKLEKILKAGASQKYETFTVTQYGTLTGSGRFIIVIELLGGTTVTLNFHHNTAKAVHFIDTFVEVGLGKMEKTQGMCGLWNLDTHREWVNANNLPSPAITAAWSWKVDPSRSLFSYAVPVAVKNKVLTLTELAGTGKDAAAKITAAKLGCTKVHQWLQAQCQYDWLAMGSPTLTLKAILEVQRVMTNHHLTGSTQTVQCLIKPGAQLSKASAWSSTCSAKCGGGIRKRTMSVVLKNHTCGALTGFKPCNMHPCPVDCKVSVWSTWSSCSNRCGAGTKNRFRTVTQIAMHGGKACPSLHDNATCTDSAACCKVSAWGRWSSCANARQTRSRTVNFGHCGHTKEERPCCELGQWTNWTSCVAGRTRRTRFTQGDPSVCAWYETVQDRPCCHVQQFGSWSSCFVNGTQHRNRILVGDPDVCALWSASERRECCHVGIWGEWSKCYNGKTIRRRTRVGACSSFHANQTETCCHEGQWAPWSECKNGSQVQEREVYGNVKECAKVARRKHRHCCVVSDWTAWSTCTDGAQNRSRSVHGHPSMCSSHKSFEKRACCHVTPWTAFTKCERGVHSRFRLVSGNSALCLNLSRTDVQPCCDPAPWSGWGNCSKGKQERTRKLVGDTKVCSTYRKKDVRDCCSVGSWGGWTPCTNGFVNRTRSVVGTKFVCQFYEPKEVKPCCHVHDWSPWSSTCKNGAFTRSRKLEGNAKYCKNWRAEDTKPCCELSVWSTWTKCSAQGKQTRSRNVTGSKLHCSGLTTHDERKCCEVGQFGPWSKCFNAKVHRSRHVLGDPFACAKFPRTETDACCKVGPWSSWSKCLGGTMFRKRQVEGHSGCATEFTPLEEVKCGVLNCKPGKWSSWSKCNNGTQLRSRMVYGDKGCVKTFPLQESRRCQDGCQMGEWSQWSNCNQGSVSRVRTLSGTCTLPHTAYTEVKKCNCTLGAWSDWGVCLNGRNSRTRASTGVCLNKPDLKESKPCDCRLSKWSLWSKCLTNGTQYRLRQATCKDLKTREERQCCSVGAFSNWTTCSERGNHSRTRTVTNSPRCRALHKATEVRHCCTVGTWSTWSPCDEKAITHRDRVVTQAPHCLAKYQQRQNKSCCNVGNWSVWSDCNKTDAWTVRSRYVKNESICHHLYPPVENKTCCVVSAWSAYGACSPAGKKLRHRTVSSYPRCVRTHNTTDSADCCLVGNWSTWSTCSPGGTRIRTRTMPQTSYCIARYAQKQWRKCCEVGNWSRWSTCEETDAWKVRSRTVVGPASCHIRHPPKENVTCCKVDAWSTWSKCHHTIGTHHRSRNVTNYPRCLRQYPKKQLRDCCVVEQWGKFSKCDHSGHKVRVRFVTPRQWCLAKHNNHEKKRCCAVTEWSAFGACKNEDGYQYRTRTVSNSTWCASHPKSDKKSCCNPSKWSAWNKCDLKTGKHQRQRTVHPAHRCRSLYPPVQNKTCCVVSQWSSFSLCTTNGTKSRVRSVQGHKTCSLLHKAKETESCCYHGPWSPWGPCKKDSQWRSRHVAGGEHCKIAFRSSEHRTCPKPAPQQAVQCSCGAWTSFSPCSGGQKVRTRTTAQPTCHSSCPKVHTVSCAAAKNPAPAPVTPAPAKKSVPVASAPVAPVAAHAAAAPAVAAPAAAAPASPGTVIPSLQGKLVSPQMYDSPAEARFRAEEDADEDPYADADQEAAYSGEEAMDDFAKEAEGENLDVPEQTN